MPTTRIGWPVINKHSIYKPYKYIKVNFILHTTNVYCFHSTLLPLHIVFISSHFHWQSLKSQGHRWPLGQAINLTQHNIFLAPGQTMSYLYICISQLVHRVTNLWVHYFCRGRPAPGFSPTAFLVFLLFFWTFVWFLSIYLIFIYIPNYFRMVF